MESTAYLHLRRISQWLSLFRKFRVVLDGRLIDHIQRGATHTYEITPGEHELQLTIDWVSSDPVTFQCEPGQHIRFVCGHPAPTWRAGLKPSTLVSSIDLAPDEEPPPTPD